MKTVRSSKASQPDKKGVSKWRSSLRWPKFTIDLSSAKQRRVFSFGCIGLFLLGTVFLIGNYRIYEYTESAEFCGEACHPMEPQFVRFKRSPHANVDCVECHIGPGASFFVKSKIDGLKQVYAVLLNSFAHPIMSPVHDLRPARETCETCHAPTSFKDNIIKTITHYDNDEANTPIRSTLILKMGGWRESAGVSQGIHWHITNEVYYISADEQRQVMLWVGVKRPDGSMEEFYARDMLTMAQTNYVEEAWREDRVRLMDCIDCHNRTAHYIPSPPEVVDDAINAGQIPRNIPYIRTKAIEVLSSSYNSSSEAYAAIDGLVDFYQVTLSNPASQADSNAASINPEVSQVDLASALSTIKDIYTDTNFPSMGLNWQTNPNNERHTPSLGCFRCHDGKHVSVDPSGYEMGTISVKCNNCHTVPIVGRGEEMLVEAPVIVGDMPASHSDFRWTIEHRSVTEAEIQTCYECHGRGFCNNAACHNLSHPPDMLFTHAEEYYKRGDQVCYTCHQNVLCSRCHPGGIVNAP